MAHYKFHNDCQSSVLTYEQVKRLDFVMDQTVPIHGRGNFPTLYVKLKELIRLVKYKLQREHSIEIRDVRLNGGAASYVLAPENSHYNDLDLIFGTDLSDEDQFDVIRDVVLECLKEFIPKDFQCQSSSSSTSSSSSSSSATHSNTNTSSTSYQMPLSSSSSISCSQQIKEAYVHKMVKVNDDDRWSLISLGVQQSEANCCSQANCSASANQKCCPDQPVDLLPKHPQEQQQQQQQQHKQFAVTLTYENEPSGQTNSRVALNENNNHNKAQAIFTNQNTNPKQQQHHQITYVHHEHQPSNQRNHYQYQQHQNYHHQQQQHQQQKKQFPNSIELKFVDRMRRKFEFSVDSFQIILDSLIQFYDYAPQSTITSQRKLINSHPSSTMINTRPLINKRSTGCNGCCNNCPARRAVLVGCETNGSSGSLSNKAKLHRENNNYNNIDSSQQAANHLNNINGFPGSTKQCASLLNSSRSYYQLPIEPANSPSISSVASSSGCSSSSSVVSSSSSSLSCDDEHEEDLYCDVDGPSSTSSSASTSSLLSSTNLSLLSSSDGQCNVSDFKPTSQQQSSTSSIHNQQQQHLHHHHHNQHNHNHHQHHQSRTESQATRVRMQDLEPKQIENDNCSNNKENEQPEDNNLAKSVQLTPSPAQVAEAAAAPTSIELTSANSSLKSEADLISLDSGKGLDAGNDEDDCVACMSSSSSSSGSSSTSRSSGQQRDNLFGCGVYDFEMNNHRTSCAVISENFYPTVIGRSEYGNFKESLYHLEKKLIATRSPEEIRGGGLLKYCNLLVKNYKPTNVYQMRTLERYMCSRFFIDFSDLNQQQAKLESYLANHFSDDPILKFDYLTILHNVVQRSTVCLMNHELRLTLNMIRDLAYKLNEQQHQQQQQQQHQHQQQQQQQQQQFIFGRK